LTFFEHHVELCGVTVLEATVRGYAWVVLEALRQQKNGKLVSHSGGQLAKLIDKRLGENTISQCIVALRKRISDTMLRERNLTVDKHDVIANKGRGYRLNADKITVRQGHQGGHTTMSPHTNVPPNVPANVPGDMAGGGTSRGHGQSGDIFNERQTWFISELKAGRTPQRTGIEEKFACSDKTAKRDLTSLRDSGTIEFVPLPRPGHYRLKAAPAHAEHRASRAAAIS